MRDLRKYVAEFIGTAVLVFVACGVAGQVCDIGGAGHLMTALAFGLVIVAMAYSIGNISGCHINPAVSLAMLISKKMSVKDFIGYVVAQYLGASVAIEIALTFVFVLAILGVTSKESNGSVAGLVIGGALVLVHLLGIPFTGTSVNPARTFGPAIFAGTLSTYWVFLIGPLAGGVLAALVWKFLAKKN